MGSRDREHIEILQLIGQAHYATTNTNHTLPLLELIDFQDITYGVIPKVGFSCRDITLPIHENSVGDVVDVLLQCIEVR